MRLAVDVDGTIDANPDEMRSILSAVKAAGHAVIVLTGTPTDKATQEDWDDKRNYLQSMGCGSCWDKLVVVPHKPGELAEAKAAYCKANGIDVLIDNSKDNAKAAIAAGVPLVLVPWASRV